MHQLFNLTSLPDELLLNILLQLDFESIAHLYKTCKRFFVFIHNSKFGKEYLFQQAKYLSSSVNIHTSISQFDVFLFGYTSILSSSITSYNTPTHSSCSSSVASPVKKTPRRTEYFDTACAFVVHHSRSDSLFQFTDIYLVHASLTGRAKTRKVRILGDFITCKLQHKKNCPICAILIPCTVTTIIDKQFIVFFQTWKDTIQVTFPVTQNTVIFHCEHQPQDMYSVWRVADFGIHSGQRQHLQETNRYSQSLQEKELVDQFENQLSFQCYSKDDQDYLNDSKNAMENQLQIYRFISKKYEQILKDARIRSLLRYKDNIVYEPWDTNQSIEINWFGLRRSEAMAIYMSIVLGLFCIK